MQLISIHAFIMDQSEENLHKIENKICNISYPTLSSWTWTNFMELVHNKVSEAIVHELGKHYHSKVLPCQTPLEILTLL